MIGPPVTLGEIRDGIPEGMRCGDRWQVNDSLPDSTLVCCCFTAVMMGDTNGVLIAQEVNEAVLTKCEVLSEDSIMRFGSLPPEGKLWTGVYIDDLGIVNAVKPDGSESREDIDRAARAEKAYADAGIVVKYDKDQKDQVGFGKIWGGEFRENVIGAPSSAIRSLMSLSMWCIAENTLSGVSGEIVERLVGSWAFPLQFRRPIFAACDAIFTWVQRCRKRKVVQLPGKVIDEIVALTFLGPLMFTNMRAVVDNLVGATDASTDGAGAAEAVVSDSVAKELFRRSELRGDNVLHTWSAEEMFGTPSRMRPPDKDVARVLCEWDWKQVFGYRFKRSDEAHINIKELRVCIEYLKRRVRGRAECHKRFIHFLDSRVCVGAVGKGRSSSRSINPFLRSMLPTLLGADVCICPLYVPTGANPGDPPSRGVLLDVWLKELRDAIGSETEECGVASALCAVTPCSRFVER